MNVLGQGVGQGDVQLDDQNFKNRNQPEGIPGKRGLEKESFQFWAGDIGKL